MASSDAMRRRSLLDVLAVVLLAAPLCVHTVQTGLQAARVCCGPGNGDCAVLSEESPRAWELRDDLSRYAQTFPRGYAFETPPAVVRTKHHRLARKTLVRHADGRSGVVVEDKRPIEGTREFRQVGTVERRSTVMCVCTQPF